MIFNSDSTDFFTSKTEEGQTNQLLKYLQHQSPDAVAMVARSVSSEIKEIISQNVHGLVGMLPSEGFDVQITAEREGLASLLASAMMTGYFLRRMEQRMELDISIADIPSIHREPSSEEPPTDCSK